MKARLKAKKDSLEPAKARELRKRMKRSQRAARSLEAKAKRVIERSQKKTKKSES